MNVWCEGDSQVATWSLLQVNYGKVTTMQETAEWAHDQRPSEDEPRERTPYEEEEGSRGSKGYYNYIPQNGRERIMLVAAVCKH